MTKAKKSKAPAPEVNDDEAPDLARRERVVLAILSTSTILDAASLAGIHERTLRRWLKRPDFAEEVRQARRQTLAQASTRLVSSAAAAADQLVALMKDKEATSAQVSAARAVLENARAFVEIDDLAAQVAELQALHAAQNDEVDA